MQPFPINNSLQMDRFKFTLLHALFYDTEAESLQEMFIPFCNLYFIFSPQIIVYIYEIQQCFVHVYTVE